MLESYSTHFPWTQNPQENDYVTVGCSVQNTNCVEQNNTTVLKGNRYKEKKNLQLKNLKTAVEFISGDELKEESL